MNNKFKEINKEESIELDMNEERIVSRGFASTPEEQARVNEIIEYAIKNLKNKVMGSEEVINGKSR